MKLTQKQQMNLRSGQTVYGVWGNTPNDMYVYCLRFLGTRRCLVHRQNIDTYLSFGSEKLYKRIPSYHSHFACGRQGQFGERLWTKRHQAEKFLQEIKDGLHPHLMGWWRARCHSFDEMDEAFGIDRGLGGVLDTDEDYFDDAEEALEREDQPQAEAGPDWTRRLDGQFLPSGDEIGSVGVALGQVIRDNTLRGMKNDFGCTHPEGCTFCNWCGFDIRPTGLVYGQPKPIDDEGVPPGPPYVKRVRRLTPTSKTEIQNET